MGGDSRSRRRGFKSQHQILNGHFSYYFIVKFITFARKRLNIKTKKRPGMDHFLKKVYTAEEDDTI